MAKAYCKAGNHFPKVLLARVCGSEEGIQLDNDGSNANFWHDGTRGVPERVYELADVDGAVCYDQDCPGYLQEVDWIHGKES